MSRLFEAVNKVFESDEDEITTLEDGYKLVDEFEDLYIEEVHRKFPEGYTIETEKQYRETWEPLVADFFEKHPELKTNLNLMRQFEQAMENENHHMALDIAKGLSGFDCYKR